MGHPIVSYSRALHSSETSHRPSINFVNNVTKIACRCVDEDNENEELNSRSSKKRNQTANSPKHGPADAFHAFDFAHENLQKENQTRIETVEEDSGEDEDDQVVRNGLERRTSYDENDEEKCSAQEYETMKVRYQFS